MNDTTTALAFIAGILLLAYLASRAQRWLAGKYEHVEELLAAQERRTESMAARLPGHEPGVLQRRVRREVLLGTKGGGTAHGILVEYDDQALVLRDASWLAEGGGQLAVDGELLVLMDDVAYLQTEG